MPPPHPGSHRTKLLVFRCLFLSWLEAFEPQTNAGTPQSWSAGRGLSLLGWQAEISQCIWFSRSNALKTQSTKKTGKRWGIPHFSRVALKKRGIVGHLYKKGGSPFFCPLFFKGWLPSLKKRRMRGPSHTPQKAGWPGRTRIALPLAWRCMQSPVNCPKNL